MLRTPAEARDRVIAVFVVCLAYYGRIIRADLPIAGIPYGHAETVLIS